MGFVVTIDGPAGAGKTSTARGVAERLGYRYLDTGALYRALALAVIRSDVDDPLGEEAVAVCEAAKVRPLWSGSGMRVLLDGADVSDSIRDRAVTRLVSPLSALAPVRAVLLAIQREAADGEGGLVAEGRDVGSVVFPDARLKIYLVADVAERARRRGLQLAAAGIEFDEEELRREIEARDRRDSSRALAPLVRPEGAIEIDTTGMTLDGQIEEIVRHAREAGG